MSEIYNQRQYSEAGVLEVARRARRRKAQRIGKTIQRSLLTLVTFVLILVFIFPFAWMALTSLKDSIAVFKDAFPLTWKTFIPGQPTLSNYATVFGETYQFGHNILNSIIVATGQVITTTIVCSLAAFVFARLDFRGRNQLFAFVMLAAFIPIEIIMVPLYIVMRTLHLTSSYFALFLPFSFSPLGVFLLRQAFMDIPKVYDEAAHLDGASIFQTYWHIILPNAVPALITQALIQFIWSWNNFLWPLVVMQDPNKKVAQVAIAAFAEAGSNRPLWGEAFAAATIATLPVLIFFFIMQRYYVQGVLMSGMK
jgi:ABC-type glycerol-3-phosphate transport system permease component